MYLDQTDNKYGQLFVSGRIGMIISGPWTFYDLAETDPDYGVAFLPGFDGDHTTVAGPDLWVLFDQQDANRAHWAYEFTKWLTVAAQDVRFNVAIGNLPLRASEASPRSSRSSAKFPGLEVLDNLANATRPARPPGTTSDCPRRSVTRSPRSCRGRRAAEALDEAAEKAERCNRRREMTSGPMTVPCRTAPARPAASRSAAGAGRHRLGFRRTGHR